MPPASELFEEDDPDDDDDTRELDNALFVTFIRMGAGAGAGAGGG